MTGCLHTLSFPVSKMGYFLRCYVVYLFALCVRSTVLSPVLEIRPISGHDIFERSRRAFVTALLAKKGALAVKSLTSDAIFIPPTRRPTNVAYNPVRQFQKKGDYSRAVQDLVAVLPERIKDFSTSTGSRGKSAIIGDRILHVKSSNEFTGFPTIEILQVGRVRPGSEATVKLTDLITYMP